MEQYLLEQLETVEDGLEQLLIFPNQRGLERSWQQLSQLFLDEETYLQSSKRQINITKDDESLRRILSDTQQKLTELYQQETANSRPVQQSITSC